MKLMQSGRPGVIFAGTLIYCSQLYLIYRDYISPAFTYLGYSYSAPRAWALVVTFMLAACPSLILPMRTDRPSTAVAWLLYILAYVPSMLIPLVSLGWSYGDLLPFQLNLLAGMLIVVMACRLPRARFRGFRLTEHGFTFLLLGGAALMYAVLVASMGVRLRIPSLDEIYSVRAEQRMAEASAGMAVYVVSWLAKVVNPCLIVLGLIRRRWGLLLLGLLGQLFMFAQGGNKSVLLVLPLIFGLDWAIRRSNKAFGFVVLGSVCFLMIACLGVDKITNTTLASSVLIRRLLVTPGLLTGFYLDFFSSHPSAFYAHSFLSNFVSYPYAQSPPFIIGLRYFGNPEMSANANIWADAYANLGHFGIFLHSAILGGALWLIDCLARPVGSRMAMLMILAPAWAIVDSALFTSLLTHGLGLLTLILWIAPAPAIHSEP